MKKMSLIMCILLLSLTQMPQTYLQAFSFNFFGKNKTETIKKEFVVLKDSQINLTNGEGSYTIKPWNQQKVALEAQKKGSQEDLKVTSIISTVTDTGLSITTETKEEGAAQVHYTLRVPEDSSITIHQTKGPVTMSGIEGDIAISLEEGSIDIKEASKGVSAKTGNGTVTVHQKKLEEGSSIFLQAHKGTIKLYLSPQTQASLEALVEKGTITSEHPVTMVLSTKLDTENWERLKKNVSGVLGSFKTIDDLKKLKNAPPITLTVGRGTIKLLEA